MSPSLWEGRRLTDGEGQKPKPDQPQETKKNARMMPRISLRLLCFFAAITSYNDEPQH